MSKKNIKVASQERQKMMEDIQEIFFSKVLDIEGAMSDKSYLSDFLPYPPEKSLGPGSKPGTIQIKVFTQKFGPLAPGETMKDRFKKIRDKSNYKESIIEVEPCMSRSEVIERTQKVFGVDISSVYDAYIVDILEHIILNYKPKTRRDS